MINRILVSIVALVCASFVFAGEEVNRSAPLEQESRVTIENTRGKIQVIGWEKAEIQVLGTLDDLAKKLAFDVRKDRAHIEVEMPRRVEEGEGSNLTIYVPFQAKVLLQDVSSEIRLENVKGGGWLKAVSGDFHVMETEGDMKLDTVSGNIFLTNHLGKLEIESISGNVQGSTKSRFVEAKSISGNIDIESPSIEAVEISSISGDLILQGPFEKRANVYLKTVSGDVSVTMVGPVSADVKITSQARSDMALDFEKSGIGLIELRGKKLEQTIGGGDGRLRITTVTGQVDLLQK